MCTTGIVVNDPDRHVHWPILIVAGRHRYGCLVTPKYNRHEHGPVCVGIVGDNVLHRQLVNGA